MIERLKEFNLQMNKRPWVAVVLGIVLGLLFLIGYHSCVSSSHKTYDSSNSTINHIESIKHESNANVISEKVKNIESVRQKEKSEFKEKLKISDKVDAKLEENKRKYEAIIDSNVNVSDNNLSEREQKLLANLRELYSR